MKVLLVDDEEAILDVFKQALQQANFDVITALTGNEGMDLTKKEHPDVIFLDQVLPDMNGNQVLQQLKADPETKMIPIAILSNFNQDTLVQNAMKMGASDYILKYQIAPQDLASKATALLQEVHMAPPTEQIGKAPTAQSPAAPAQQTAQPVPTPVPAQPVAVPAAQPVASTAQPPAAPAVSSTQPEEKPVQ